MSKSNQIKLVAILAGPLDNQSAGVHVYTKELIAALAQNRNRKHKYILIREQENQDYPEFKHIVVPTISWLPGFSTLRLFFLIPLVCRLLKVAAVVEPAHFGPFNLPKSIKRITVIHDLTPILFPEFHTFNGWFLQKIFLARIIKKADLVIANSNHTRKDIEKVFPLSKGKVETIYLGVSENFKPKRDPSILIKYGIKQPFFLNVGTIEPRKNLNLLLEAFEIFKKANNKNYQLIFIGKKGWKCETFFKKIERHPYKSAIKVLGYTPFEELPIFYTMCSAFIYPSIYEGFGLPVAEAISCNAQCIIANNSSLVEVGGKEVIFFDTKEELVSLMLNVSAQGNVRSEDTIFSDRTFSWKKNSALFENHIHNLIKRSEKK